MWQTNGTYRQRGTSSLQKLFRAHFPDLHARYEAEFAKRLGRIQCSNPECRADYFRPLGCRVFSPYGGQPHRLCPSCSQKPTPCSHTRRILALARAVPALHRCYHSAGNGHSSRQPSSPSWSISSTSRRSGRRVDSSVLRGCLDG